MLVNYGFWADIDENYKIDSFVWSVVELNHAYLLSVYLMFYMNIKMNNIYLYNSQFNFLKRKLLWEMVDMNQKLFIPPRLFT